MRLHAERIEEIVFNLTEKQQTFSCHKTVDYSSSNGGEENRKTEHCAGALIFLEELNKPNQMMRWMERIGVYDSHKLTDQETVYKSVEDMLCEANP